MSSLMSDPWLRALAVNGLLLWPVLRILGRAGFSRWWAVAMVIPVLGLLIVMAKLAARPWPALPPRAPKA